MIRRLRSADCHDKNLAPQGHPSARPADRRWALLHSVMSVPIIYIQDSDKSYLPYVLWQARATNPKSDIIIITSPCAFYYRRDFQFFDINHFIKSFLEFSRWFVNFSTNDKSFEIKCFSRWFILHDFLHAQGIQRCVHLDSDVLVYSDLSRLADELSNYWMTTVEISGHTNFINNRSFFDDWIAGIVKTYQDPDRDRNLRQKVEEYYQVRGEVGGISDMTFHTENRLAHPDRVIDLQHVRPDQTVFDVTLDHPMGMKLNAHGVKDLVWKDGIPFGTLNEEGGQVRFHTLHFQGTKKSMIPRYTRPSPEESWLRYYRQRRAVGVFAHKVALELGWMRDLG